MKNFKKIMVLMISLFLTVQLAVPAVFANQGNIVAEEKGNVNPENAPDGFTDSPEDSDVGNEKEQPNEGADGENNENTSSGNASGGGSVSGGSSSGSSSSGGNYRGGTSGGSLSGGASSSKVPASKNPASKKTIVLTIGKLEASVDGKTVVNDTAPIIANERTMLPIRFIAEELGADVGWTPETKTATVTLDKIEISIVIGSETATVNSKAVALDSPAFIEGGRTYLPLRFIMEELGADVSWDGKTKTVTIIG